MWDNAEEALPHMPTARATTAPVSIYDLVHAGSNQPTDSADEATYFMSTRPRRAHYWLLRWFPPLEPETCPRARFTFLADVSPYAAGAVLASYLLAALLHCWPGGGLWIRS